MRALFGTAAVVVLWLWFLISQGRGLGWPIPLLIFVALAFSLFVPALWLYGGLMRRYFRSRQARTVEAEQQAAHVRWWEDFSSAIEAQARVRPEHPLKPGASE